MEQKIVILGNGFDLRHFLPTSYNHLISILSEIEKLPENKDTITFSDLFGNLFKKKDEWFYQKIVEYYQTKNFIFDLESIQSLRNRLKENSWFQYFKSVDENKIETWIDFETEIERVLLLILQYFDEFNNGTFESKPQFGSLGRTSPGFSIPIKSHNKCFKNQLQIFLLNNFNLLSKTYDAYHIDNKYIVSIAKEIQYYKERDFFNSLYYSLLEFIGIFNDYITTIINIFYENLRKEKEENFIRKGNLKIFDKVSKIYSFNYTQTYNCFYQIKDTLEKLSLIIDMDNIRINQTDCIHGYVVNDWDDQIEEHRNINLEKLKIVLGVNDINDSLKKHKLFQFTKYFQKLHKQTDYLFLEEYQRDSAVVKKMKKYIFYFWGHSLDYSDREYIKEVFQFLDYENNKIKIFYHSISAKGDQLRNLLGIIPKEIIESYMKAKKLEFIEATSENLFNEL